MKNMYAITRDDNLESFVAKCEGMLNVGWIPVGGVCYSHAIDRWTDHKDGTQIEDVEMWAQAFTMTSLHD